MPPITPPAMAAVFDFDEKPAVALGAGGLGSGVTAGGPLSVNLANFSHSINGHNYHAHTCIGYSRTILRRR